MVVVEEEQPDYLTEIEEYLVEREDGEETEVEESEDDEEEEEEEVDIEKEYEENYFYVVVTGNTLMITLPTLGKYLTELRYSVYVDGVALELVEANWTLNANILVCAEQLQEGATYKETEVELDIYDITADEWQSFTYIVEIQVFW